MKNRLIAPANSLEFQLDRLCAGRQRISPSNFFSGSSFKAVKHTLGVAFHFRRLVPGICKRSDEETDYGARVELRPVQKQSIRIHWHFVRVQGAQFDFTRTDSSGMFPRECIFVYMRIMEQNDKELPGGIRECCETLSRHLGERGRLFAPMLARSLGRGGVIGVSRAAGFARSTTGRVRGNLKERRTQVSVEPRPDSLHAPRGARLYWSKFEKAEETYWYSGRGKDGNRKVRHNATAGEADAEDLKSSFTNAGVPSIVFEHGKISGTSMNNIDEIVKQVVQRELEPAEIVKLTLEETVDADGDPILDIEVVFKAA